MINSVTCTQTSQGLPYLPFVTQFLHTTLLDVLAFTSTRRCGLPTAAFTELTDAQRYCVQVIYTEFRPNRLTNLGSTLKKFVYGFHYMYFHETQTCSTFRQTTTLNCTKIQKNRLISDTRSQSDIRTDRQTCLSYSARRPRNRNMLETSILIKLKLTAVLV